MRKVYERRLLEAVSVRMKEVRSLRIIWKGSQIKKMIGIKMWKEMQ